MGPCQIIDGVEAMIGVCGATADTGATLAASSCRELAMQPLQSLGSCVDSSRFLNLADLLLKEGLGEELADLPLAVTAPTWISERIVSAAQCLVASGISSFFHELPVSGSRKMADYLQNGCCTEYGACWRIEADPAKLAQGLVDLIQTKRKEVGI